MREWFPVCSVPGHAVWVRCWRTTGGKWAEGSWPVVPVCRWSPRCKATLYQCPDHGGDLVRFPELPGTSPSWWSLWSVRQLMYLFFKEKMNNLIWAFKERHKFDPTHAKPVIVSPLASAVVWPRTVWVRWPFWRRAALHTGPRWPWPCGSMSCQQMWNCGPAAQRTAPRQNSGRPTWPMRSHLHLRLGLTDRQMFEISLLVTWQCLNINQNDREFM